jgi:hypothetical protein
MTFAEYLKYIDSLHREGKLVLDTDINPHILEVYRLHGPRLKEEYFNTLEAGLASGNVAALNSTLGFLITNPIEEKDIIRFQNILIATFSITERYTNEEEMPVLLNFLWVMLDYTLHQSCLADETTFFRSLSRFLTFLESVKEKYPNDVDLLIQKIMHFSNVKKNRRGTR